MPSRLWICWHRHAAWKWWRRHDVSNVGAVVGLESGCRRVGSLSAAAALNATQSWTSLALLCGFKMDTTAQARLVPRGFGHRWRHCSARVMLAPWREFGQCVYLVPSLKPFYEKCVKCKGGGEGFIIPQLAPGGVLDAPLHARSCLCTWFFYLKK